MSKLKNHLNLRPSRGQKLVQLAGYGLNNSDPEKLSEDVLATHSKKNEDKESYIQTWLDSVDENSCSPYQDSSTSYVPSTDDDQSSSDSFLIPFQKEITLPKMQTAISGVEEKNNEQNSDKQNSVDDYITNRMNQMSKKRTSCKFCKNNVTNFERHLVRHHKEEKEVRDLSRFMTNNKENRNMRRKIIALMRYETQFEEFIQNDNDDTNKLPCSHCKKLVSTNYLRRHFKLCSVKPLNESGKRTQHRAQSQTLLASASESTSTSATLRLKREVFVKMRADHISLVAKKDPLIRHFGENYLKKHKRAQIHTACSNKLRECARLLIEMRNRTGITDLNFIDILSTTSFDNVIASTRIISGYNEESKQFKSPSLAMHMGTLLKQIADLCSHLVLKKVLASNHVEEKLKDLKRFKSMVENHWNCEISSLATKDLAEKKWNRPVKLPLTKDVMKFRDYVTKVATDNFELLKKQYTDEQAFKKLVEASLCLTILFNRRRIGDVQYVSVESYLQDFESTDQTEFLERLSESEKALTKNYKRVVAGGKGSRSIVILFPTNLQEYINLLLKVRSDRKTVPKENPYLFAYPHVKDNWVRADVVIRKFAKASNLENPDAISSNRLRKQIATLMQIINLNKEEYAQFAKFMGHTEKTHQEFYEITQDAYQTAKISKILNLFDKGQGDQYKGKTITEIEELPSSESEEPESEEVNFECSEDATIVPSTSRHKQIVKKGNRVRWTDKQKQIVERHFKKHIKTKTAPKKEECLNLIKENKDILHNLDWVKVKTYVYNKYKND